MNAELRPVRTSTEQTLVAAMEAVRTTLPGDGAIKKLRESAARAFAESGLPHRRIEDWKYTDLRTLLRETAPLAPPPEAEAVQQAKKIDLFPGVELRRLVLVNGAFVRELSDVDNLEKGLSIFSLAQATTEGHALVGHIGKLKPETYDAALALNTAFLNDGVLIEIAQDAEINRPIHISHCFTGKIAAATYARSLIIVGANAKAMVVESFTGSDSVGYQTNSVTELHVGAKAQFDLIRLQSEGKTAIHLSTLLADIDKETKFFLGSVTFGAAVSRFSVSLCFSGENIEGRFAAANLLRAKQHADTTLVLEHAKPGCSSRELVKSVLDNDSRGIFQGRIVVKSNAQKTDARMATHALMLSDTAESYNKPELEIFADDVQCGHGATSGALDENLLFYFLARGIPRKEAEALLIQSFVAESIETVAHEGLREALLNRAGDWLAKRA